MHQDNLNKFTDLSALGLNSDLLYPTQQNQSSNQFIMSSFGLNQNPSTEKMNLQDVLSKQYTSITSAATMANPPSELDYTSNKYYPTKSDTDFMSIVMKEQSKVSPLSSMINTNNQTEQLVQKLGMLEIQNKEQEERIQNLQKLNDQLMSAITDLNGNDQSKKYQKEKDLLLKQHEKEVSDYVSQIKDLKNRLELQKAQMNEKITELEKDKLILDKQLQEEEKSYQKKLQLYKEEKDQLNSILKDYESMRQKNQEAVQITLENKIRVLEEVIEKQKHEAEERNGQLANDTEKIIQNMKQIHENDKSILMSKISALQGEKKLIEQQSEYNFKMFTELRNKSENQQDGLYTELDKTRKFINGLEQKIMEKESVIIVQQQKIDGNDMVLRLREKNFEEQLKTLRIQNDQLQEQFKKQSHELKLLQFQVQEKQFELTDKSKQLKKQIWNEKKKAEQMEEAANRIKDDYSKKNSFVIQELLMKEERIKKLNTKIHKQSTIQNQMAQLNFNSNNNNNTSYSFINNTNLSNLMQNQSILQQNQNNGVQNRPSHRQADKNQLLSLPNNANINLVINQDNFNSSDNLLTNYNHNNNHSLSKSPKLQTNPQIMGSVMSQLQDSVPTSNRNNNNLLQQKNSTITPPGSEQLIQSNPNFNQSRYLQHQRNASNYQSETGKNNSQIGLENNFNSCQVIHNILSINSPSNANTLPQLTQEFMSPQSQKLDLTHSELQSMRGLAQVIPSTNSQLPKNDIISKSKRSQSQAVSPIAAMSTKININNLQNSKNNTKMQQQQQNNQQKHVNQHLSNKSTSNSPLNFQQKEITGSNLTLITYDASQKKMQNKKNFSSINEEILNTTANKRSIPQTSQNLKGTHHNRSTSPINNTHNQSVNSCSSYRDVEKTKQSRNQRNISIDQNKKNNVNNKVVGVTININKDQLNQQQIPSQIQNKNLSVQATPLNSVNLNLMLNQQSDNNINVNNNNINNKSNSYFSNQIALTPDTGKNKSSYTTPNTQRNSNNANTQNTNNFSQIHQQLLLYHNTSLQESNSNSKEGQTQQQNFNNIQQFQGNFQPQNTEIYLPHNTNSIQQQPRRDITFGTPMADKLQSEMSQKVIKTLEDTQFQHQYQSNPMNNNLMANLNNGRNTPIQSKIKKILDQFNYIQNNSAQNQLNSAQNTMHFNSQTYNEGSQYNSQMQQYPSFSVQNINNAQPKHKEMEAIFFEQMREAILAYPEVYEQSNGMLRRSIESKDIHSALNGLREIINKININEQEKRELQIEINTLQSKCSLEKTSIQNNPTITNNNYNETQNNFNTTSIADSKVNQIYLENLQTKTIETSQGITNTLEKENLRVPNSLEMNNKFKPITLLNQNGYPMCVNNLSLNLAGLKSPQFSSSSNNEDQHAHSHILQQNTDIMNNYNLKFENGMVSKTNQQLASNKNNFGQNEKNISYNQFNSARGSNKLPNDQTNLQQLNSNKVQNKHFASISISISNGNKDADHSPTMYRVNSGLNHTRNSQSTYCNNQFNLSNNSNHTQQIQNENNKHNINFNANNNNQIANGKTQLHKNANTDLLKLPSKATINNNQMGNKKINHLKDIIQS